MTMRFKPKTTTPGPTGGLYVIFEWLDWMRTASPTGPGWTIVKSSAGSLGPANIDQDNITAFGDLNYYSAGTSQSWFVIQNPAGAQFLWARYDGNYVNWRVYYSAVGDYTGGDVGNAPSSVTNVNYGWKQYVNTTTNIIHMGADDAAPYGFWLYSHAPGNFASHTASWAWIPVISTQAGDTDPYVFFGSNVNFGGGYTVSYLTDHDNDHTKTWMACIPPGGTTSAITPALAYKADSIIVIPSSCPIDANGADLSFPIPYGRADTEAAPNGFKGFSTFMQWNGAGRAAGETFAARTRVSWGDVNFEWDGSVPEIS